jgi:hypothetical protein
MRLFTFCSSRGEPTSPALWAVASEGPTIRHTATIMLAYISIAAGVPVRSCICVGSKCGSSVGIRLGACCSAAAAAAAANGGNADSCYSGDRRLCCCRYSVPCLTGSSRIRWEVASVIDSCCGHTAGWWYNSVSSMSPAIVR